MTFHHGCSSWCSCLAARPGTDSTRWCSSHCAHLARRRELRRGAVAARPRPPPARRPRSCRPLSSARARLARPRPATPCRSVARGPGQHAGRTPVARALQLPGLHGSAGRTPRDRLTRRPAPGYPRYGRTRPAPAAPLHLDPAADTCRRARGGTRHGTGHPHDQQPQLRVVVAARLAAVPDGGARLRRGGPARGRPGHPRRAAAAVAVVPGAAARARGRDGVGRPRDRRVPAGALPACGPAARTSRSPARTAARSAARCTAGSSTCARRCR